MPMSPHTPRRNFLTRLAGGAAALAMGPRLGSVSATTPPAVATTSATGAEWDDSWVRRITAPHRQVFDSPEIEEGVALHQARTWIQGYREVYQTTDSDHSAVIVIRHAAVPMVMDDTIWERLELGKANELKDPASGEWAQRNPFMNVQPGDQYSLVWPDGGLDKLMERGAIVVACNLALQRIVRLIRAANPSATLEEAQAEMLAHVVPGVVVMPSGIFAVTRAQEAGCHYIRSG